MARGKVRRWWLMTVRKDQAARDMSRRRGECGRCGACCKLVFRCPAYDDSSGEPRCTLYNDRPGVCGLFPINEADLRDRDIVMPDDQCGFYFVKDDDGRFTPVTIERRLDDLKRHPAPVRAVLGSLRFARKFMLAPFGHGKKD